MIFADTITELLPQADVLLRPCRKLLFHNDVYETALELVANDKGQIAKIAKFVCWPDHDTWIECQTERGSFGFLFYGQTSTTIGTGTMFIRERHIEGNPLMIPVRYDLPGYSLSWWDIKAVAQDTMERNRAAALDYLRKTDDGALGLSWYLNDLAQQHDPIAEATSHSDILAAWKPLLFALLALINSPKLIRVTETDVSKLNKARLKRGRYLFHPHHEVRINIDRHIGKVTKAPGHGPEREQYFVRAHPRFLVHPRYRNVSVIMVPPHYRGNPELGMRNTSYIVDRQETKWKN